MTESVRLKRQPPLAIITFDRPQAGNGLDWAAQSRFARVVRQVSEDDTLRALVLTGAGTRTFVSGGDLRQLAQQSDKASGRRLKQGMTETLARLQALPVPVLAAVNGHAVGGGCEIVTACDLVLAHETATFRFAQVAMGLVTGWGGAGRLVGRVGQARALDWLLTGRAVTAHEAQAAGLVHRVTSEPVLPAAVSWAQQLAALPREAVAGLKQLVYAWGKMPASDWLALEERLFVSLWGEPDHREAVQAFLEKRTPSFNQRGAS